MPKLTISTVVNRHGISPHDILKINDLISILQEDIKIGASYIELEIECGEGYCEDFAIITFYQRLETDEEEAKRQEDERIAQENRPKRLEQMYLYELARLNRKYGK